MEDGSFIFSIPALYLVGPMYFSWPRCHLNFLVTFLHLCKENVVSIAKQARTASVHIIFHS
jgi:hypothetical protein